MKTMTSKEAFEAMILFLEKQADLSGETTLSELLSDLDTNIWTDGDAADPAVARDWLECVEAVVRKKLEAAE